MSSRPWWKTSSFRLTIWSSLILLVGTSLMFLLAYLLLSSSIRESHRQVALAKLDQYARLIQIQGVTALIEELKQEHLANQRTGYLVRLSDDKGRTLLLTWPEGLTRIEPSELEGFKFSTPRQWLVVGLAGSQDFLEITNLVVAKDLFLQVGFGLSEREILLGHFRRVFLLIIVPVLILGILGGHFLARRALAPVRDLIKAIHNIDQGQLSERVPARQSNDELDELVRLFNGMLAKIETLVNGMRATLDNVAHDLRTPLTRLRAGVEGCLQKDSNPEQLRETLLDCAEESEKILQMLDILLDVSEAETGTMKLNLEDVVVSGLLAEVRDLYQYALEEKSVDLRLEVPADLCVRADRHRLRQVLANLLDNALKFSEAGGQVRIKGDRENGEMVIRVQDNGPGISAEDLPHIFERLYRGGDKSRGHRGLGLGLSLVAAVLQAHHGRVSVNSRLNQGAEFEIHLPIGPA